MEVHGNARDLAEVMRIAYERGLTTGAGGNASLSVGYGILITPSGKFKGRLEENDIILINEKGDVIRGKGKPSSEWKMHVLLYKRRRDIKAVLHCHPPIVTGLTNAGIIPPPAELNRVNAWTEESHLLLGSEVRVIDRRPFGTLELANAVSDALADGSSNAVVIKGHGAVVVGSDPWAALSAMDSLVELYTINFLMWLSKRFSQ